MEKSKKENSEKNENLKLDKPKGAKKGASRRITKKEKERQLAPLRDAAKQIADMLCEFSGDRELFLSDGTLPARKRLDTKALKEFSSVLKEISAVVSELNGEGEESSGVRIEFSDEALDMGV